MNIIKQLKCKKFKNLLNIYIDGYLQTDEKNKLELHLSNCTDCLLEMSKLKRTKELLNTSKKKVVPIGFEHELHLKLAQTGFDAQQKEYRFKPIFPNLQLKYILTGILILLFIPSFVLFQYKKNKNQSFEQYASTTINLNQVSIFKFKINNTANTLNSSLNIELPNGIKFERNGKIIDQKEINYNIDLDEGENIIAVYIIGIKPGKWSINTKIKNNNTVKKIKIPISVL